MPTVQLEAQISSDELLKAVQQLPPTELDKFVDQVLSLRAHHVTQSLPQTESELLLKINQSIPADLQKRYDELIGKRNAESLTESDHQELLVLTKQVEKLEVQRIEN
ncbi:MAG: STAS/SEC14 domain-containing protein, partial [Chloroflexi bacterium]|nr:STAS/SEC14 domain-containing protein [Chloroflexota bacterium]